MDIQRRMSGGQIGNRKKPVGGIDIVLLYPLAPCVTTLAIIVGNIFPYCLGHSKVKGNEENTVLLYPLAPCVTFQHLLLLIIGYIFSSAISAIAQSGHNQGRQKKLREQKKLSSHTLALRKYKRTIYCYLHFLFFNFLMQCNILHEIHSREPRESHK